MRLYRQMVFDAYLLLTHRRRKYASLHKHAPTNPIPD